MMSPHETLPVETTGPPPAEAEAAMILLHGRGSEAWAMLELTEELSVPDVAYLAPQAAGRTWYPHSFLAPWEQNEPYLSSALSKVGAVVDQALSAGVRHERVMILGFSQGACLAAEFAYRNLRRYAALFVLTGGLIGREITPRAQYQGSFAGCPILIASGDPDPHVPWQRVQETADLMSELGGEVELLRFPGRPHSISEYELTRVRELMAGVINSRST